IDGYLRERQRLLTVTRGTLRAQPAVGVPLREGDLEAADRERRADRAAGRNDDEPRALRVGVEHVPALTASAAAAEAGEALGAGLADGPVCGRAGRAHFGQQRLQGRGAGRLLERFGRELLGLVDAAGRERRGGEAGEHAAELARRGGRDERIGRRQLGSERRERRAR